MRIDTSKKPEKIIKRVSNSPHELMISTREMEAIPI
jgi:hypothetical protein